MDSRLTDTRLDASRLESLLESAKLLSSSLKLEDQLRHLLRTVMGRLLIMRAVVALKDGDELKVALARGVPGLKVGADFDATHACDLGLASIHAIGDQGEPLGVLALGTPARGELEPGEVDFLDALLSLAAASIANAKAHDDVVKSNRALDQKIQELRALLDLVRGLAATIDADEVAQMLMLTLSGRWAVRKHGMLTWKANQPPIVRAKGIEASELEAWRGLLDESGNTQEVGEFLLFPLRSGDTICGLVALGPRPAKLAYTASDLDFCTGLIAQASVALDNAWHFRDTLYRQQLEKELTLAASIQQDLFPKQLPALRQSDIWARNRQARQVGGDYYDVLPIGPCGPDTPHLLCVADISGKGISASLLMANIQATLRALLSAHPALIDLAARTNDLLFASTPGNKYSTAIFVRYDPVSGQCEYVNGGHSDGILLRANGAVEMLTTTGLPIGLFPKREYEAVQFDIHPGDVLMIYSDGVTDACTVDDFEFGVDRAVECVKRTSHLPAQEILDHVFQSIDEFADGAPQFDDITVMVLKRTD
ncbi:PP2C family protein-serine/threonine phosphatase [uncultured Paludibaculum sp.]|uniref:PP2C family protein-serine/threonine phosphatase n=1 Tax=uncultured Paludibaculum sp. TaxID=1765020 RepID=UPI002AAB0028|nr:PP2C family protein-serine/threonine phosphatase [uncultured Paludibaculum sp.]